MNDGYCLFCEVCELNSNDELCIVSKPGLNEGSNLFEGECDHFIKDLRGDFVSVRPLGGLSITLLPEGKLLVVQVIVHGEALQ